MPRAGSHQGQLVRGFNNNAGRYLAPTAPGEVVGRATGRRWRVLVLLAVASLEACHATTGVEDFLLAGVERVAC